MLIVKFLHELQHRATRLFFHLRLGFSVDGSTPKRPRRSERRQSSPAAAVKQIVDDGLVTPRCSQVSPGKSLGDAPQCVGSMRFNGEIRGDSGYELEEELLGGRLRHRHLEGLCGFQVNRLLSNSRCIVCDDYWQMEELILVVGESSTDAGTEFWYTEDGVKKQLDKLEKGTRTEDQKDQNPMVYFDLLSRRSF